MGARAVVVWVHAGDDATKREAGAPVKHRVGLIRYPEGDGHVTLRRRRERRVVHGVRGEWAHTPRRCLISVGEAQ